MKLFIVYTIIVTAGAGFVIFYNNHDAWCALVIGVSLYLLALFMVRDNKDKD